MTTKKIVIPQHCKILYDCLIVYNRLFLPVNDCPDPKYFQYVSEKVCAADTTKPRTKWRDLGIALMGINAAPGLDVIRINYPNNVEECCLRMFNKWRQTTTTGSWGKLLQALKEIKLVELVSELEELLSIKQGDKMSQVQQFGFQELEGIYKLQLDVPSLVPQTLRSQGAYRLEIISALRPKGLGDETKKFYV